MTELEAWQLIKRTASDAAKHLAERPEAHRWPDPKGSREWLHRKVSIIGFSLADIPHSRWRGLVEPLTAAGAGIELIEDGLRINPPAEHADIPKLRSALEALALIAETKAAGLQQPTEGQ